MCVKVNVTALSTDAAYNGVSKLLAFVNNDNDAAGITVSAPQPSSTTTETGSTATFTVVLSSEPTLAVSLGVASSNTAEGAVSAAGGFPLVFTAGNWNVPQTV